MVTSDDATTQPHDDMARARLAAIVTASSEAIIGVTLDGIITDWNPAAERLYGYSSAEVIGQPLTVLAPPDRAGEVRELLERVGNGESVAELETVRSTKSGRLIDVSKTIWPVHTDAGQIIAAATITRDISLRKTAEADLAATHQQTRQVLERMTDGFYALDRDWRFTYINPMAEKILGRPRDELLGKIIWDELGDTTETSLYAAYHQAMNERVNSRVELYYFPLGAWFEARVYPSAAGLSIFFRDLTARKELERRLGASETRYRALVEQIPAAVYVLAADENQTPLYFSPYI
jgi:PAS domain S-box-containing protein